MKIALVGCAPTWKLAPFADPEWQIWAHCSCQPLQFPRVDRWFDLHTIEVWRQGKAWYRPEPNGPRTYVDWLASRPEPVVMQQHYPIVPTSLAFPLREVAEEFGIVPEAWGLTPDDPDWWAHVRNRGEFAATACYMVALALHEGVDELATFGIDFIGELPQHSKKIPEQAAQAYRLERTIQRAGMKYWVGLARGLGVPVTIAQGSWFEWAPFQYGYERTPEMVMP